MYAPGNFMHQAFLIYFYCCFFFKVIVVLVPEMFLETFLTAVTSEGMNDGSYMFIHWKFSPALNQSSRLSVPHPKNTLQSLLQIGPLTVSQSSYDQFTSHNSLSQPVSEDYVQFIVMCLS